MNPLPRSTAPLTSGSVVLSYLCEARPITALRLGAEDDDEEERACVFPFKHQGETHVNCKQNVDDETGISKS